MPYSVARKIRAWGAIVVLLLGVTAQAAPTEVNLMLLPDSQLELFGDSTFHKFSSKATQMQVEGKIERDGGARASAGLNLKQSGFAITLPVAGLKSGDSTLDEHLMDAMKAGKFPQIRGVLKSYEVKGKGAPFQVTASVDLTIAGVTKTVPIDATVTVDGEKVRIRGEKQLLMTDFNIDPPTMMLGVIKTANEILIRFNLEVSDAQGKKS